MKIKDKSYSIVLAGKWNLYILTPEWIVNNLYEEKPDIKVEFSVNLDSPLRFRINNTLICPTPDKVVLIAITPNEESLIELERLAIILYSTLIHTPINAVGINFGFVETTSKDHLFPIFNYSDKDLLSQNGWVIKNASLKRQLIKNDLLLNLSIVLDDNNNINFDFNFHIDYIKDIALKDILEGKTVECLKSATQVLENIYQLKFETNE